MRIRLRKRKRVEVQTKKGDGKKSIKKEGEEFHGDEKDMSLKWFVVLSYFHVLLLLFLPFYFVPCAFSDAHKRLDWILLCVVFRRTDVTFSLVQYYFVYT